MQGLTVSEIPEQSHPEPGKQQVEGLDCLLYKTVMKAKI